MITEGAGIPLAVSLTGGNRNDVTQLIPLIEAIPPVRGRRGRPRRRPKIVYADRGYDHDSHRRRVHAKGIGTRIARRGAEHGSGLGVHRWVVEQTVALLHWFRRLRIRWEIRDDIHESVHDLGMRDHLLSQTHQVIILLGVLSPTWVPTRVIKSAVVGQLISRGHETLGSGTCEAEGNDDEKRVLELLTE